MSNKVWIVALVIVIIAGIGAFAINNGYFGALGDNSEAQPALSGNAGGPADTRMFGSSGADIRPVPHPTQGQEGSVEGDQGGSGSEDDGSAEDSGSTEGEEGEAGVEQDADGDEGTAEDGEAAEAAEGEETADDEGAEETVDESAEGEPGEEAVADEEEFIEDDPIERFKQMDPRDILTAKYGDLESRLTSPWLADDPNGEFIPETGRRDPLTRVHSAVPDDLKPPRAGESDESEIQTYLVSAACSEAVTLVSYLLECYNVLQVGLEKRATFSLAGSRRFTLSSMGRSSFQLPFSSGGIGVTISIGLMDISTNQVTVGISAQGNGTSTSVSKTQVYIPRSYY